MQMNKKYLSVIILTAVLVLSIVICIVVGNIKFINPTPSDTPADKSNQTNPSVVQTEIIEIGGTTDVIPVNTDNPTNSTTNNVLDGIMDDIYDKSKPVIIDPVYGNNINNGSAGYELDGQAVTTIYDTVESTRNGETTPEPETTTSAPVTTVTQPSVEAENKKTASVDPTEETTGIS